MIALANNAAQICDAMGMDIDNVLAGLQTKVDQFGLRLAKPGIGPGGHCIPEDIHYVIKKARQNNIDTSFLESAAQLNDKMPGYAISKLQNKMAIAGDKLADMNVALLGVSYKEDVGDIRRSPAVELGYQMIRHAKSLLVHDPYVDLIRSEPIRGATSMHSLESVLEKADIVIIGAGHSIYKKELTSELLTKYNIKYVLDGRNILSSKTFMGSNIAYVGVGR